MISQERLEAIVINALIDGKNAAQVSRETGVPVERVQLAMHKVNGKDPARAAAATRHKARQENRQVFGNAVPTGLTPRIGPNRARGRRQR